MTSMSLHDPLVALRHMLDHAREAVALARGHSRNGLDDNRVLQLAPTRLVEIVGEAASQARHSQLPWREAISARNRLIHGGSRDDVSGIAVPFKDAGLEPVPGC